jgi:hypothetical protein
MQVYRTLTVFIKKINVLKNIYIHTTYLTPEIRRTKWLDETMKCYRKPSSSKLKTDKYFTRLLNYSVK